jgi:hypothetical protein
VNISTRLHVGPGEGQAIAGFVIGGSEGKSAEIRVAGPSLAQYGIAGRWRIPRSRSCACRTTQ